MGTYLLLYRYPVLCVQCHIKALNPLLYVCDHGNLPAPTRILCVQCLVKALNPIIYIYDHGNIPAPIWIFCFHVLLKR